MDHTRVSNMVCTLCKRTHGQPHNPTCPMLYDGDEPELSAYENGYLNGREQATEVAESYKHRARHVMEDAQIILGSEQVEPIRQALIRNGLI